VVRELDARHRHPVAFKRELRATRWTDRPSGWDADSVSARDARGDAMGFRDGTMGFSGQDSPVSVGGRSGRRARLLLVVGAALVVLCAAGWYLAQRSTDTVVSSNPDLVLLSTDHKGTVCGRRVLTGVIGNRGRSVIPHVAVDIALLDAGGSQVGTAFATTDRLEPGAVWEFSAPPNASRMSTRRVITIADR
jgi:hypothetical protein